MRVWIFQFPIDTRIHHQWLEKCFPKDKFNKSTRWICLIYFCMAPFIDYIKFPLGSLNNNNLMLINFHISLIPKRFLRSFDLHCDKTITLNELLPNINKFRNKILNFFQKVSRMWLLNCSSYCDTCLESHYFFQEMPSSEFIPFFYSNGLQNWVHLPIFFTPCPQRPVFIGRVNSLNLMLSTWLQHKSTINNTWIYLTYNPVFEWKYNIIIFWLRNQTMSNRVWENQ